MADKFIKACLLVGAVGDLSLQLLTWKWDVAKGWGFEKYFKYHQPLPSIFIASGMMGLIGLAHVTLIGEPTVISCAIVGGSLDVLFRLLHPSIMPRLKEYYASLNPFWTIVWGILPMEMALYLSSLL